MRLPGTLRVAAVKTLVSDPAPDDAGLGLGMIVEWLEHLERRRTSNFWALCPTRPHEQLLKISKSSIGSCYSKYIGVMWDSGFKCQGLGGTGQSPIISWIGAQG